MKLLDLFCGAGGSAMGYARAGFTEIVGVDCKPQKRYPFTFVQGDALRYLAESGHHFDCIHASPPCQPFSRTKSLHGNSHPDLIEPTRALLKRIGKPYIIENVPQCPLENAILLCGTHFDLKVYRHRIFEIAPLQVARACHLAHVPHGDQCPAVGRGLSPKGFVSVTGSGGFGFPDGLAYAKAAMGIEWMSRRELSQAIPPAYTQFLGSHLLAFLHQK